MACFYRFFVFIIVAKLLVGFNLQASSTPGVFPETPVQKIVRQTYSVLNGPHYAFGDPEQEIYTNLSADTFAKRVDERTKNPAFYSKDGIKPSLAVQRLLTPREGDNNYIECNIAASICQYAVMMDALGGGRAFDAFSDNASSIYAELRPSQPRVNFLPIVLLGNRIDTKENFAKDLLLGSIGFNLEKLEVGCVVAISNDQDYYKRHPQGLFGAENVTFYGWKGTPMQSDPLFFGFQGIFKDGQPHTLLEIQRAMLEDYLREPTHGEQLMIHDAERLGSEKHVTTVRKLLASIGIERVALSLCKPQTIRLLNTQNIEVIKRKIKVTTFT